MNPIYAQMLKTLKVAYPQQIPPFEQQMNTLAKQDLSILVNQINSLRKEENKLQSELDTISNTQVANLHQNIKKKDDLNFLKTKIAVCIASYYRIKRFLLIYHNTRLNKIQNQYWNYSGGLKEQNKTNLSEAQKLYFNDYKALATQYMDAVGLDLTTDVDPPVDAAVEVLFMKDCGEILDDEGKTVSLGNNSVITIKRRLIENFIQDGSAQIVSKNCEG